MSKYYDLFTSWEDVQREFSMTESEPDEVLLAMYTYEGYDGSALVVYRTGNTYFVATGSHCSCYGLEDQWSPIEYENKELLIECLKREKYYDGRDKLLNEVINEAAIR